MCKTDGYFARISTHHGSITSEIITKMACNPAVLVLYIICAYILVLFGQASQDGGCNGATETLPGF